MFGFVNQALQHLITREFGKEKWEQIRCAAKIDEDLKKDEEFLIRKLYDDEVTYRLVAAARRILDADISGVLQKFGEQFIHWCHEFGYDHLLTLLGGNLLEFLSNLDALHDHLANEYPGMRAPSFRCEQDVEDPSCVLLHYYSERWGLHDIVIGIIQSVAKDEYNQSLEMTLEFAEHLPKNGMTECYHAVFRIRLTPEEGQDDLPQAPISGTLVCPSGTLLNSVTFCQAFPFHMVINSDMMIVQAGVTLQRLVCMYNTSPRLPSFNDLFQMVRPHMDLVTFDSILSHIHTVFVVNTRAGKVLPGPEWTELEPDAMENECDDIPILRLKGEMIYESERNLLLYLSSPRICSFSDLGKRGLSVSHIPISDSTRELILHNNVYSNDQDRIFQLELRTDELRRAQSQLLSANKRLDDLLYSILPVSVADRLRCKDFVEPERFDQVTVLMSDIVSYTKIGQECQAIDVIKMLQELYSLFDSAARRNEVYKVETVGDAYIVVGGVPERAANHAVNVANQALDMISATKHVKNPRPGEGCVKIRIGIHTGMVYAGVVGVKMPRYCLFGRTVTMAQKAEAAAPHNGILVTEMTFNLLEKDPRFSLHKSRSLSLTGSYNKAITSYTMERGQGNEFVPLEPVAMTEWMLRFVPPSKESSPAGSPVKDSPLKNKVLQAYSAPGGALQEANAADSSDEDTKLILEMKQNKRRKGPVPTFSPPNINLLQKSTSLYSPTSSIQLTNIRISSRNPSHLVSPELVTSSSSTDGITKHRPSESSIYSTTDSELSIQSAAAGDADILYCPIVPKFNVPRTHNYTDL